MRRRAIIPLALLLAGCATAQKAEPSSTVTTLIFGTRIGDTHNVSDAEWEQFVEQQIVPRFPGGFTLTPADGRWRGADGKTIREKSYVLLIVRPPGDTEMDRRLEALRRLYCTQFKQEAVLRIDEPDARVRF